MDADERRRIEALLRVSSPGDWTLERLLGFVDAGIGVSVSLLVDGRWIEGELAPQEKWTDHLDDGMDQGMRDAAARKEREHGRITDPASLKPGTVTVGDVERLRATLSKGSFRSVLDENRKLQRETQDALDQLSDDAEIPEDLADQIWIEGDPFSALTLTNVFIEGFMPARDRRLPILRVLRSSIGAWHLGRTTLSG